MQRKVHHRAYGEAIESLALVGAEGRAVEGRCDDEERAIVGIRELLDQRCDTSRLRVGRPALTRRGHGGATERADDADEHQDADEEGDPRASARGEDTGHSGGEGSHHTSSAAGPRAAIAR